MHFLHVPGQGPAPFPLLLSHGWPGSIWEFHKLIPLLTDPVAHGGAAEDAFTVVAPSLPGYTLSFREGQRRFGTPEIADAFVELMRDVLGYQRFAAQGGDWGAFISANMAFKYPQHLAGIHLNLLPLVRTPPPGDTDDVVAFRKELDNWVNEESGYLTIQGTRPQTLAYGLTDSPVGLAAWIVEKYRVWSDCGGDVERRFSKDELLTTIMLYWVDGLDRQLVLAVLRPPPSGLADTGRHANRGSHRVRVVPARHPAPAPRDGRANVQHPALDGVRAGRPLRGARGARSAGRGRARVLPPAAIRLRRSLPGNSPALVSGPNVRPGYAAAK